MTEKTYYEAIKSHVENYMARGKDEYFNGFEQPEDAVTRVIISRIEENNFWDNIIDEVVTEIIDKKLTEKDI